MPAGRPIDYTVDLGDRICAGIASGKSLVKICKADDMPCETSVYKWRREFQEFTDNYARAREDAADFFVQEIMEIADSAEADDVQVAKLRVDTRKSTASRFNRAYIERTAAEVKHKGGMALTALDSDELDDRIRELHRELDQSAED